MKCECGCEEETRVASRTDRTRGQVKGRPLRYLPGHVHRSRLPEYIIDSSGCWVWQRTQNGQSYGEIWHDGGKRAAHRVYFEREHGPIPDGMQIDHLCRNTLCVNPAHLELVSNAVNTQRGNKAKLNPSAVRIIRTSAESAVAVAARFGVSRSAVDHVRARRRWGNVV